MSDTPQRHRSRQRNETHLFPSTGKGYFYAPRALSREFVIIGDCVKRTGNISLLIYTPDFRPFWSVLFYHTRLCKVYAPTAASNTQKNRFRQPNYNGLHRPCSCKSEMFSFLTGKLSILPAKFQTTLEIYSKDNTCYYKAYSKVLPPASLKNTLSFSTMLYFFVCYESKTGCFDCNSESKSIKTAR